MTLERLVRTRLVAVLLIALVLAVGAISAVTVTLVRAQTEAGVVDATQAAARIIRQVADPAVGDPAQVCNRLLAAVTTGDSSAVRLAVRANDVSCAQQRADARLLDGSDRAALRRTHVRGASVIIATGATTSVESGTTVWIAAIRPLAQEHRTWQRLAQVAAGMLMIGVGLALFASLIISRRLARPIEQLAEQSRALSTTGSASGRVGAVAHAPQEVASLQQDIDQLLASLAASRAEQERLVSDTSHELRAPVGAMSANISSLGTAIDQGNEPMIREIAAHLQQQSGELAQLVDDLLLLARGRLPDETREPRSVADIVVERSTAWRSRWPHAVIDIDIPPSPAGGAAQQPNVDTALLLRAFDNMVANAISHGASPVCITVTEGVSGAWSVAVRDAGDGFTEASAAGMFERFATFPTRHTGASSGLGGSIIAKAAADHGGTALAANHPDGGGVVTVSVSASSRT